MSDTVTLRLRISPDDVKRIEERIKRAGGQPIDVPVRAPGLSQVERQAKFAEGSVGALKSKIRELNAEMDHLADSDALEKKQAEIIGLEKQLTGLLAKSSALRTAGAAGAAAQTAGAAASGASSLLSGGMSAAMLTKLGGIGAAVGGVAALTSALQDGARKAIELDTEVRNIGSLGVEKFEQFREISREMSTRLPQSAAEIARGTYQAISAGVDPMKAGQFVEVAAKAGIAGLTSTETAVNALTSVVNAYRLGADGARQVSDQMFTAVKLGKTTFEEINQAIANVVPVGASAKVSFGQIAAGLATMTKQGIPTTQASTQMRQAIVELLKPGEELAAVMEKAGIANGAAALKTFGLQGTLQKLQVAADSSGKTMTQVFSSVEAGSAALALTGENAAMAASDLEAMANSAGAMGKAYEVNAKSAANQLKLLGNNVDAVKMAVVETFGPAANWVLENFAGGLQRINEMLMSTEALMRRTEQRGQEAYADQALRQRTMDRAQAAKMLGLENEAALDNIKITREMVRGMAAAKNQTDEQIDATVKYWQALQNAAAAPPPADLNAGAGTGKSKRTGVNEALQLALEQLRAEEELAMLRAKYTKASESEVLDIRLGFLQRQLAAQIEHKDKAVAIARTRHEIEKAELEKGMLALNQVVAGSIADLEKRLREAQTALTGIKPDTAAWREQVLLVDRLGTQLDELKKKASDPIYSILPGFRYAPVDEKGFAENMKNALSMEEREKEQLRQEYGQLGNALGSAVGDELGKAVEKQQSVGAALKNIYRSILAETLEFVVRKAILAQVAGALEEIATKGLFGIITAGLITATITGLTQVARGAITGYATGGVIVGEAGPEVISPARDFSSFADRIVEGALDAFGRALRTVDRIEREARRERIDVGVTAAPVEIRLRGNDLRGALTLADRRERRGTLGDQ